MQNTTALINMEGTRVMAAFRDFAEGAGQPVSQDDGGLTVSVKRGTLTIAPKGAGTTIKIETRDEAALQTIRDMLVDRLGEMGLSPDWQDDLTGKRPGNQSLTQVTSVERISPSFMRVEIEGPDLARFATGGLHFRLLFGPDGAPWPVMDAKGATDWPGGMQAWHRPVYTTRAITTDGDAARIAFDVFRHDGGRVTEWCDRVTPGTEMAITGPGGNALPAHVGWQGLIGDETAMPVVARILEAMREDARGEAVLFVPDLADRQDIRHPEGVSLRWVLRGGEETPLDAVKALRLPDTDRRIFFAAERSEATAVRNHLSQAGLQKGTFKAAAYWTAEEADRAT